MQAEKEAPKEPEAMETDTAADAHAAPEGGNASAEPPIGPEAPLASEPMAE